VIESPDTDQASVVFMGRKSFRMQVVGAPAAATGAGAVPVGTWDTPTERIFERRRSPQVAWPPPTPAAPAMGKSTVVGIALVTFACGVLVATAVDRLRPHAFERMGRIDVAQAPPAVAATPAPAATPAAGATSAPAATPAAAATPTTATAPATKDHVAAKPVTATTVPAPVAAPAALAAAGPIVQQLPPPAPEPLPTLPAPVADAAPAAGRPAAVKATRPRPTTPATKARASLVEPPPLTSLGVTFTTPPAPAAKKAAAAVTPPTPGKWVDPFAE
jgi:hypothetical protein